MCLLYDNGILRYTDCNERGGIVSPEIGGSPHMNEIAKKYVNLFRQVKIATAATVDAQGHPQARIINVMLAEDDGMYIVTSKGKPFYKQLVESGEIALAAMCPGCQPLKFTGRLHP